MAKKTTEKRAPNTRNSVIKIVVRGAAIGLAAVIASFVYLIVLAIPEHNRQVAQQMSTAIAVTQAESVNTLLQQWQSRLQNFGRDPELLDAFNTQADLTALQARAQIAFPEALQTRLIALGPLGIASVDNNQAGLRNNIEADMLRRASNGSAVQPEAYQLDKKWVISFAQPVMGADSKYAAGAILVTLPASYLEQILARQLGNHGSIDIAQLAGNNGVNFAHAGNGDVAEATYAATLSVPNWKLQFAPASIWLKSSQQSILLPLLLAALCCVAILLGVLLSARDFRRALERSLQALLGSHAAELPGFAEAREQIQRKQPPAPAKVAAPAPAAPPVPAQIVEEVAELPVQMPDTIFRAYDIRGIAAQQLTDDIVYQIGLGIGSEAVDRGQQQIIVARDGRASSDAIADALMRGLRDSGRDVIDIGLAPTPLMYFATHHLDTQSGVMVTGSHNAAAYNGVKMVIGGKTLSGRAIQALKERIQQRRFSKGKGSYRTEYIQDRYVDYIINDVAIAQPLKIVIDAGNGVAGMIAPRLFQELGCEVIPLYCDVDPAFPHHDPDPTIADNLRDLVQLVHENGADLGIAFDGDADRVAVVTGSGEIVPADRLLMVLAQDVVARNPGADVLFDVKCSRSLNSVISSFGGRPIMWKAGHSFMKEKMAETGALLGGEFSGHIFFNERWFGFDDGMYAAARLIEILSTTDPNLDNQLAALPQTVSTPELKIDSDETAKFALMEKLSLNGKFGDGKLTTLDGIRVDFPDGWGLVRASNTSPALTLRFEADNEAALERIQTLFKEQLAAIDPNLRFGF